MLRKVPRGHHPAVPQQEPVSSLPFDRSQEVTASQRSSVFQSCPLPVSVSSDGCKLVHKSCNSFSSCSTEFPQRFSGLLPIAWLLRFLVNCVALCSALPFVQTQRGSRGPGICRVLAMNRSKATSLLLAGPPPPQQGGCTVDKAPRAQS